jgi:hypothetical protein
LREGATISLSRRPSFLTADTNYYNLRKIARTLVTSGLHTDVNVAEQAVVIPGMAEGVHNGMSYPAQVKLLQSMLDRLRHSELSVSEFQGVVQVIEWMQVEQKKLGIGESACDGFGQTDVQWLYGRRACIGTGGAVRARQFGERPKCSRRQSTGYRAVSAA